MLSVASPSATPSNVTATEVSAGARACRSSYCSHGGQRLAWSPGAGSVVMNLNYAPAQRPPAMQSGVCVVWVGCSGGGAGLGRTDRTGSSWEDQVAGGPADGLSPLWETQQEGAFAQPSTAAQPPLPPHTPGLHTGFLWRCHHPRHNNNTSGCPLPVPFGIPASLRAAPTTLIRKAVSPCWLQTLGWLCGDRLQLKGGRALSASQLVLDQPVTRQWAGGS